MSNKIIWLIASSIALLFVPLLYIQGQEDITLSEKERLVSFPEFLESLESANANVYIQRADTRVASKAAFDEMRAHIQKMYDGVQAQYSFMGHDEHYYDCIAFEQQPSLRSTDKERRGKSHPSHTAPSLPSEPGAVSEQFPQQAKPLSTRQASSRDQDKFGHAMFCPPGSIPMRRITLEDMTRFETLEEYLMGGQKRSTPDQQPQ